MNQYKLCFYVWIEVDETNLPIWLSRSSEVKVKVTRRPNLQKWPFSKFISSAIYGARSGLMMDYESCRNSHFRFRCRFMGLLDWWKLANTASLTGYCEARNGPRFMRLVSFDRITSGVSDMIKRSRMSRGLELGKKLLFMKFAVFKIYLLHHLWSEVGFDDGLWIYGTISKIRQSGVFTFGFVFDLNDFEFGDNGNWHQVQTTDVRPLMALGVRSNPLVSFDKTAREVSKMITWPRVTCHVI